MGATAFLGRTLFGWLVDCDLEIRRAELEQEGVRAVERLRAELSRDAERTDHLHDEIRRWANPILDAVDGLLGRLRNLLYDEGWVALRPDGVPHPEWVITHDYELWPDLGDDGLRGRRIVAGVQACQDLQRERYAVTETTSILPFRQSDEVDDPLTALAREGARRILAEAGAAEADAFVAAFAEARLEDGRRRVVRHGHGPERAIQTGVGPVPVRRPKSLPRT